MTVRQLRANRRNAHLGGARTPEGKQKVSRNGLVHGLCAEANQCMILDGESLEVFTALDANFKQHYVPVDEVERSLVERMVTLTWRGMRQAGWETGIINLQMSEQREEAAAILRPPAAQARQCLAVRTLADNSRVLDLLDRYSKSLATQYRSTFLTLVDVQKARISGLHKAGTTPIPEFRPSPKPPVLPNPQPQPEQSQLLCDEKPELQSNPIPDIGHHPQPVDIAVPKSEILTDINGVPIPPFDPTPYILRESQRVKSPHEPLHPASDDTERKGRI